MTTRRHDPVGEALAEQPDFCGLALDDHLYWVVGGEMCAKGVNRWEQRSLCSLLVDAIVLREGIGEQLSFINSQHRTRAIHDADAQAVLVNDRDTRGVDAEQLPTGGR